MKRSQLAIRLSQTGGIDLCRWSVSSEAVGPCRGLTHRRYPDKPGPHSASLIPENEAVKSESASFHSRINLLKTKKNLPLECCDYSHILGFVYQMV